MSQSRQSGHHNYNFGYQIGPVVMLPLRTEWSVPHENFAFQSLLFYDPENGIFFLITSEISKLGHFVYFIYRQSTKLDIILNFRVPYNR